MLPKVFIDRFYAGRGLPRRGLVDVIDPGGSGMLDEDLNKAAVAALMQMPDSIESPHKGQSGIRRLVNAFYYSLAGISVAFRHESAFRQEIVLAAVLIPIACLLPVSPVERVLLITSVLLVLIVELLNSSIEAAIDRISFDTHQLSKRAKDLGSAAVLVALTLLLVTWLLVAGPVALRYMGM